MLIVVRLRHLSMQASWQHWEVALASPPLFYRNGFAEETQTLVPGLSECKAQASAFLSRLLGCGAVGGPGGGES